MTATAIAYDDDAFSACLPNNDDSNGNGSGDCAVDGAPL